MPVVSSGKLKVFAIALAIGAVVGGGAALAATKPWSPHEESQAVVNDAAKQLGVTPAQLTNALKKALENRIDDAVASGLLTKAQGDELKQRIESSDVPFPFGFFGPKLGFGLGRLGPFATFDTAASYLGISESKLGSELAQGKTLAQIAKGEGKSVDGLVQALVKAAGDRIDAAVKDGKLTQSQGEELKSNLKQRMTDLVNGELRFGHAFRFGRGFGFGAPKFRFPGFGFARPNGFPGFPPDMRPRSSSRSA